MQNVSTHPGPEAGKRGIADHVTVALSPQIAAVATFCAISLVVLMSILSQTGGHFTYSLDDPYIHLALSERIARGHYGINLDEVTSPSSSILWPFLILPGVGTALHGYVPIALNLGLGLVTVLLCARFAAALPLPSQDKAAGWRRAVIASLLVLATNVVGLAYTGMEHNLQVLIAVVVALGLIEIWHDRPLPLWAIVAAGIGPAVRYELFALTAAVAIVLLVARRWRMLVLLGLGSLALPVAFSAFLVANGNAALPTSVLTKLRLVGATDGAAWLTRLILPPNWYEYYLSKLLMWMILLVLCTGWWRSQGPRRTVLGAAAVAGILHMIFGQFGWFHRYEVYAIAFCGLIALLHIAETAPRMLLIVALMAGTHYLEPVMRTPAAALNIHEQQYQMHRFVTDHYRKSFAVNDIGWVSFNLDPRIYVLDIYGLASNEASRMSSRPAPWLDDVTRRHRAGLAMIYTKWLPRLPDTWTKVGEMHLSVPRTIAAEDSVSFFATAVGDKAEIIRQLEAFKATLPPKVRLTIASP